MRNEKSIYMELAVTGKENVTHSLFQLFKIKVTKYFLASLHLQPLQILETTLHVNMCVGESSGFDTMWPLLAPAIVF